MNIKYDIEDFEKVVARELTIKDLAIKYGVSENRIRVALNKRGFHLHKRIKIVSPYKTIICQDKQKCADELKVSRQTIIKALKGVEIPMFKELGITIKYEGDGNDD